MMRPRRLIRLGINTGLLALALSTIWRGERQVIRESLAERERWFQGSSDPAVQIERLMTQVDDVLPPHGNIGYLDPAHSWTNAKSTRQFYLTQYALAPRVLLNSTAPSHVLYFSHQEEPLTEERIPPGMRVLLQVRLDLAVLTRTE